MTAGIAIKGGEKLHPTLGACSFCGADLFSSRRSVQGPGVQICEQCVLLCCEALGWRCVPLDGASEEASR